MAAFLSFTHKMAAWEFCLQDGGVSEGFTHKMAAWEICLQHGGNTNQTKRKQKQRRIYLTFASRDVTPCDTIVAHVRHYNVTPDDRKAVNI